MICLGWLLAAGACNESESIRDVVLTTTLEFEYEKMVISENAGTAKIPVALSGMATREVTVAISVEYGDDLLPGEQAKEGVHFNIPVKTATIAQGSSYAVFAIELIDDIVINDDRKFDLRIESIEGGATAASISQVSRITIKNDDFWPEVTFSAERIAIPETDELLVLPLEVGGGVIRSPFTVELEVENLTATEGVDFTIEKKSFTFTEENRVDSVVIHLTAPDPMDDNISFKLRYHVNNAGITGSYEEAEIVLQKVFKYAAFGKRINWMYQGYTSMVVPVSFTGLRSSRDITAKIRVKSVEGGLQLSDIVLPSETISTQGDTTLYFPFQLTASIIGNFDAAVELEIETVEGGEMGIITSTWVRTREVDNLDRSGWSASGIRSDNGAKDEATNEGAGNGIGGAVLDGNNNSYWHTIWSGGNTPLPHILMIDFGGQAIIPEKVSLRHRSGYRDAVRTQIYFNVDEENPTWEYVGDMVDAVNTSGGTVIFWVDRWIRAYGMRMNVVQLYTGRNTTAVAEVNISGRQDN